MPSKTAKMTSATQTILTVPRSIVFPCLEGFGEQTDVNGNNKDIWIGPTDVQPEPDTAGFALWVESSSDADNGATATGALTGTVHYLDINGAVQEVDYILNGLTPVNTGVTDCGFVQENHIMSVGSGLVAAGNIDCTKGSGGTVVSRIDNTGNQSLSTMRQVPAGKNLFLQAWHAAAIAAAGGKIAKIRLRSTWHNEGKENQPGVYNFIDISKAKDNSTGLLTFPSPVFLGPLTTVKISAWTTGAMDLSGAWRGWLEDV